MRTGAYVFLNDRNVFYRARALRYWRARGLEIQRFGVARLMRGVLKIERVTLFAHSRAYTQARTQRDINARRRRRSNRSRRPR